VKTREFFFNLPERLIAQKPPLRRGTTRLLVLDREAAGVRHCSISALPGLLAPGTLLVLNDTRVRKARLFGTALASGGRVEFLLLEELVPGRWQTLAGKAKKQRVGKRFVFPGRQEAVVVAAEGPYRTLEFQPPIDEAYLERFGHMPLPPYIRRDDDAEDAERYQTVYARHIGSAAAPTAGLHLTSGMLAALQDRGIILATVTLHVGVGTFLPIRSRILEDHRMHGEKYVVPPATAELVDRAGREGRKIVAVGTTVVRTLEAASGAPGLRSGPGETDIFITPGYRFRVVSGLLTNFHLPESTLLVLVSAFAGRERVLAAYEEAIAKEYSFFSYGDAMLVL
jgi:S-adenosylmethionine:tRNA ribosyltransferase-isomerase